MLVAIIAIVILPDQTKWLLAILLAGIIFYPIAVKIVDRVFPDPKSPIIMQNPPIQQ
jgi:hypothetical protein